MEILDRGGLEADNADLEALTRLMLIAYVVCEPRGGLKYLLF